MKKDKPNILKDIYIRKDQIMSDVDLQVEIISDTHLLADGSRNPVFENAEIRYRSLFTRWLDKYVDNVKSRIAAYLVVPTQHGSMNAVRDWSEQRLHLSFPWYWNDTTFPQLTGAIHDYIVNSILFEFCAITITSKDPITSDKQMLAEEAYQKIKYYCISAKPYTTMRRLMPFG